MNESDSKTAERMLEIFGDCRKNSTEPYDESHFLDFLTDPPKSLGGFRDSFAGLRRYNKFIDAVQMEFTVHFSVRDLDTNFSVDRFVSRIGDLRGNPTASLRSLGNAMKRSDSGFILPANIVAIVVLVLTFRFPTVFYPLAIVAVAFNLWAVRFVLRSRRYQKQLHTALSERKRAAASGRKAPVGWPEVE